MYFTFAMILKGSGHLSHKETMKKVRNKYYWSVCRKDVRTYVVGCEKCLEKKQPNVAKKAPIKVVESEIPMKR